jgi:hypothetical protein
VSASLSLYIYMPRNDLSRLIDGMRWERLG